jgi:hypothetical protein
MQQARRRSSAQKSGFNGDEDLDKDAWVGEKHFEFATEGVKQSTRSSYVQMKEARNFSPQESPSGGEQQKVSEYGMKDNKAVQRAVDGLRRLSISDMLAKRAREQRHLPPKTLRFRNMVKFSGDFMAGGVVMATDVDLVAARLTEVKKTQDARFQNQLAKKERHRTRPHRLDGITPGF